MTTFIRSIYPNRCQPCNPPPLSSDPITQFTICYSTISFQPVLQQQGSLTMHYVIRSSPSLRLPVYIHQTLVPFSLRFIHCLFHLETSSVHPSNSCTVHLMFHTLPLSPWDFQCTSIELLHLSAYVSYSAPFTFTAIAFLPNSPKTWSLK